MIRLWPLDAIAGLVFVCGFVLAFRPTVFRRGGVSEDAASAFRIGGVMIMAFSVMIGVFANLIAWYSARGTG
ncbi:MAG: hypothetical protein J7515_07410 [Caulobacter sp.]|nr:hypothetical protein [Caulobacter sp.]